jgi:hypothetical protein
MSVLAPGMQGFVVSLLLGIFLLALGVLFRNVTIARLGIYIHFLAGTLMVLGILSDYI